MPGNLAVDRVGAGAGEGQRVAIAFGSQRPLLGVDDEEATVEVALRHSPEIDLGDLVRDRMRSSEVPAFASEIDRRVEMGVEDEQIAVQVERIGRAFDSGGRAAGQRDQAQRQECAGSHCVSPYGLKSRS